MGWQHVDKHVDLFEKKGNQKIIEKHQIIRKVVYKSLQNQLLETIW